MIDVVTKLPNPHTRPLGQFLRALARKVQPYTPNPKKAWTPKRHSPIKPAREPRHTAAEISRAATLRHAGNERVVRDAVKSEGILLAAMTPYATRRHLSKLAGLPLAVVQDQLVALGLEA